MQKSVFNSSGPSFINPYSGNQLKSLDFFKKTKPAGASYIPSSFGSFGQNTPITLSDSAKSSDSPSFFGDTPWNKDLSSYSTIGGNPINDGYVPESMSLGPGYGSDMIDSLDIDGPPKLDGAWMEGGKLALQGAQVGLGVYNAMEQSKMNKFMQGYYGNQMAQSKVDFNNNVDSANLRLSNQLENKASAAGFTFGSDENKNRVAAGMDQWGAKKFNG